MKKIFIAILLLVAYKNADAQFRRGEQMVVVNWEIAFPTGEDFIDETSFSGFNFEYRKFIQPNLSIGGGIGWNSFGQSVGVRTYESADKNTAITTGMYRYVYKLPMTINVNYYFDASDMFVPFVGLGMGAQFSDQEIYFSNYVLSDDNWGFLLKPTVGGLIRFNHDVSAYVAGVYSYSTNDNEYFRIDNLQHFGIQLGLAFNAGR